jgi:BirA family biotin operon repressor/biotin-[acetyl-CoA-carboxylase] ligase
LRRTRRAPSETSCRARFHAAYSLPEVDSTNRFAADLAREGEPEGTLVVADYQSAGRGRFDRLWESPEGKNLLFSLILRPDAPARGVLPVTLVFSAAIADTLGALTGRDTGVKWPNDVVVESKKLCGILAEGSAAGGRSLFVIVGVGINVNTRAEDFTRELGERSCSCLTLTGREWDRGEILARVVTALERAYLEFAGEGLEELLGVYKSKLVILGRNVAVERQGSRTIARVVDVALDGGLVVEGPQGQVILYDDEVTMLRDEGG